MYQIQESLVTIIYITITYISYIYIVNTVIVVDEFILNLCRMQTLRTFEYVIISCNLICHYGFDLLYVHVTAS